MSKEERVTVEHAMSRENNSFGLIRLVLACSVIFSHSWSLGGYGAEPLFDSAGHALGAAAVTGFFALSGILVGFSAERSSLVDYLGNRVRRIIPAYWACLAVTALLFAPVIGVVRKLDLKTVLLAPKDESALTYIVNNFPLASSQLKLGQVLDGLPFPHAINVSLWSLPLEFACYLVVVAFVALYINARRSRSVLFLVVASSIGLAVITNIPGTNFPVIQVPVLGRFESRVFYSLWLTFLMGTVLSLLRTRLFITRSLAGLAVLGVIASLPLGVFWPVGCLILPYAIIGVAYYLPKFLRTIGRSTDISYGMYLYGFPVSQLIVASLGATFIGGGFWLAALTIAGCVPISLMSWYLVEKPFLAKRIARS